MEEDDLSKYVNDPLWPILVETVHSMIMYRYHKTYVEEKILREKPEISPRELAARLGIPLGEALVILYELRGKAKGKLI
ncbi:hypothetical protein KEJ14_02140 [Candidatus Bathyarchaeota archaeon]|nr:hypothetical protein [Candidatus Bathyarchaeota archaeon]